MIDSALVIICISKRRLLLQRIQESNHELQVLRTTINNTSCRPWQWLWLQIQDVDMYQGNSYIHTLVTARSSMIYLNILDFLKHSPFPPPPPLPPSSPLMTPIHSPPLPCPPSLLILKPLNPQIWQRLSIKVLLVLLSTVLQYYNTYLPSNTKTSHSIEDPTNSIPLLDIISNLNFIRYHHALSDDVQTPNPPMSWCNALPGPPYKLTTSFHLSLYLPRRSDARCQKRSDIHLKGHPPFPPNSILDIILPSSGPGVARGLIQTTKEIIVSSPVITVLVPGDIGRGPSIRIAISTTFGQHSAVHSFIVIVVVRIPLDSTPFTFVIHNSAGTESFFSLKIFYFLNPWGPIIFIHHLRDTHFLFISSPLRFDIQDFLS